MALGMVHDEQMASEFCLSGEYRMDRVRFGGISNCVYSDSYVYISDHKNS
jgi:hypothetical protein